jgi:TFIIF-interacting CTD phosphatase-like protein
MSAFYLNQDKAEFNFSIYRCHLDDIAKTPETDKCIILDLDETLVHTADDYNTLSQLKIMTDAKLMDVKSRVFTVTLHDVTEAKGSGSIAKMWGITRPHLTEFIKFCFSYFRIVAVWSAGKKRYVEEVVNKIFGNIRMPHIIFTYNDCQYTGGSGSVLTKPIAKLISQIPELKNYMSLNNTVIIDDRQTVFTSVNPNNGIIIPAYDPAPSIESLRKDDYYLPMLMNWFRKPEVMKAPNVQLLDKSSIFNTALNVVSK